MSQSPVHLRPKAKRALNWDAKPPEKPRRVRRWAAGLGERLKAWRHRPALRQAALALALCLLGCCYAMMPPESAATSVLATKRILPVHPASADPRRLFHGGKQAHCHRRQAQAGSHGIL